LELITSYSCKSIWLKLQMENYNLAEEIGSKQAKL